MQLSLDGLSGRLLSAPVLNVTHSGVAGLSVRLMSAPVFELSASGFRRHHFRQKSPFQQFRGASCRGA